MNMKQYLLSLEKCYPNFDGKLTKRYKQKKRLKNEIIAYNIINKSMNRVPGYQNDNNNKNKKTKKCGSHNIHFFNSKCLIINTYHALVIIMMKW